MPTFDVVRSAGFTIVELVVVIILVGILGAVGLSRYLDRDAFETVVVSSQLISAVRSAQQRSIGRSNVSLTLQRQGESLDMIVEDSSGEVQRSEASVANATLSGDVNITSSCGLVSGSHILGGGNQMVLEFGRFGELRQGGVTSASGYPESVSEGMRICVNNEPLYSVCISKAGYAYAGNCIE